MTWNRLQPDFGSWCVKIAVFVISEFGEPHIDHSWDLWLAIEKCIELERSIVAIFLFLQISLILWCLNLWSAPARWITSVTHNFQDMEFTMYTFNLNGTVVLTNPLQTHKPRVTERLFQFVRGLASGTGFNQSGPAKIQKVFCSAIPNVRPSRAGFAVPHEMQ